MHACMHACSCVSSVVVVVVIIEQDGWMERTQPVSRFCVAYHIRERLPAGDRVMLLSPTNVCLSTRPAAAAAAAAIEKVR